MVGGAALCAALTLRSRPRAGIDRSALPAASRGAQQDAAKRRKLDDGSAASSAAPSAAGDERGAAKGSSAAAEAPRAARAAAAEAPPARVKSKYELVLERETKIRDRNNVLLSSKSFQAILTWEKNLKKLGDAAPGLQEGGLDDQAAKAAAAAAAAAPTRAFGVPIIVVPSAVTSVITLFNVQEFLEKGVFRPTKELRAAGAKKPTEVLVERVHPTLGVIRYKVVDSVKRFQPRHWDRVVAVFASGKEWQFKGWRWKSPVEIFTRCQGMHVYFDDEAVASTVRSWAVAPFALKKQTRNSDRLQCHGIWKVVDHWMMINAPSLLPSVKRENDEDDE